MVSTLYISWPTAFTALSIVIIALTIVMYKSRDTIRENNVKLQENNKLLQVKISSNEALSAALERTTVALNESKIREDRLQRTLDNLIIKRDDLFECMKAAPDDAARVECIKRFTTLTDEG